MVLIGIDPLAILIFQNRQKQKLNKKNNNIFDTHFYSNDMQWFGSS